MRRLTTSTARTLFAEIVNKAHYIRETTVITRHGKDWAAVVPMPVPAGDANLPKKKPPKSSMQEKKKN
jgi:hypothetical protein